MDLLLVHDDSVLQEQWLVVFTGFPLDTKISDTISVTGAYQKTSDVVIDAWRLGAIVNRRVAGRLQRPPDGYSTTGYRFWCFNGTLQVLQLLVLPLLVLLLQVQMARNICRSWPNLVLPWSTMGLGFKT